MKTIVQYILEKNGVSDNINILTKYIYDLLKQDVYKENPENPKISWLYQQCKNYGHDFYPIEINFDDIEGFDSKRYNLLTYRDMGEDYADYDCDMIVNVKSMTNFGEMDTDEPQLSINSKYIRTIKTFEKNEANIKNTIAHELTHYVQHQANKKGTGVKFKNGSVTVEFHKNTQYSQKYYICNFILYTIDPNEADARKSGFYQNMLIDLDKRLKEWKKQNKGKEFDKEDFINYCMYHKDYRDNVLHMYYFDLFGDAIKDDNWETYEKCFDDKENKYRDDSIIYVLLNICDVRSNPPILPMPSKKNYVMNINNEKRFNEYKEKLLKHYNKNINRYKKKIKKVIELALEEKHII